MGMSRAFKGLLLSALVLTGQTEADDVLLRSAQPEYDEARYGAPEPARVVFTVFQNGELFGIETERGLEEVEVEALRQYRFKPQGQPFQVSMMIALRRLKKSSEPVPESRSVQESQPIPENPGIVAAKIRKQARPQYPREARDRGIQGKVVFLAIIGKNGKIRELLFKGGPIALYDEARNAVRQWEYSPTLIDGNPVEVITEIEVNFTLR
jgi:TonB family protein